MLPRRFFLICATLGALCLHPLTSFGQIRTFSGYNANTFAGNDDNSTGPIALNFSLNFNGQVFNQFFLNNNGNITFNLPSSAFTPTSFSGATNPIIAPFFADVDTTSGAAVTYGAGTLSSYNVFAVNWLDVRVFGTVNSPTNQFQLLLVDRSDTGAGNFDIEFNYSQILWESGLQSGGNSAGLGGTSAFVGYSDGNGNFVDLPGSGVSGYFLDRLIAGDGLSLTATTNPTALIGGSLGQAFDGAATGRYVFSIRNPAPVPDAGSTGALAGLTLALVLWRRSRR